MKRLLIIFAVALAASAQAPDGAFLGTFKMGSGPKTWGGAAGYTFKATDALGGIGGFGAALWTPDGSMVTAGIIKRVFGIGDYTTVYCDGTAGIASEQTTGFAGNTGCIVDFALAKVPKFGAALNRLLPDAAFFAGGHLVGANVKGYTFGSWHIVPGFGIRFKVTK